MKKITNIDSDIRIHLLVNPSLSVDYCQGVFKRLEGMSQEKKRDLLLKLQEGTELLRKRVIDAQSNAQRSKALHEMVIDHVSQLEGQLGKMTLNDIDKVQQATGLKLKSMTDKFITPENLFLAGREYVKGQDEMLRGVAMQVYLHKMRMEHPEMRLPKCNMLIYGPSGVGKTYAVQVMTRLVDIPVGRLNCAILTQEGIVGYNFHDVFTDIYTANGEDLDKVANAIIVADEVDKLFGPGEYNARVRNEILPALDDDSNVYFNRTRRSNSSDYIHVSTRNISFILSGVFKDVVDVAAKRLNRFQLGFAAQGGSAREVGFGDVKSVDFQTYFKSPELSGRIGSYVAARELTVDDLSDILLRAEESPLNSYVNFFRIHDRNVELRKDGATEIAKYALQHGLGVRGMKSLLSNILADEMQQVGSVNASKRDLVLDKEYIDFQINKL